MMMRIIDEGVEERMEVNVAVFLTILFFLDGFCNRIVLEAMGQLLGKIIPPIHKKKLQGEFSLSCSNK